MSIVCCTTNRDFFSSSIGYLIRSNPWEREPEINEDFYTPEVMHYLKNLANKRPKFSQKDENIHLDIHTKRAALKASPFVVSLVSYSAAEELNQASGVIISSDDANIGIVITSAHLIRQPAEGVSAEDKLAADLKVLVKLSDGRSYEGEIRAYDFHYNIAAISFLADSPVLSATPSRIDETLDVIAHNSSSSNLTPGDAVVAVGRYFSPPFEIMAAPGVFSLDRCNYDCKELFMSTCKTTRCGDGGPLINLSGDVLGITFYDDHFTPFLPINIAYKWWENYKRHGRELRRPYVGVEAMNFYAADLDVIEKVLQKFPNVSKGVSVEQVTPGSPADSAGLRFNDVIFQCGGKAVQSFLEFLEIMWDNVGHHVELVVARPGHATLLPLNITVAELELDKLNSWPWWENNDTFQA